MKVTRKRRIIGSVVVVGIAGLVVSFHLIHPARPIAVEIRGSSGQTVNATFLVDGTQHNETLQTPATRNFYASEFAFWIDREADAEKPELAVTLSLQDKIFGTAKASEPDQCACGAIRSASLLRLRREVSFVAPTSRDAVRVRWLPEAYQMN